MHRKEGFLGMIEIFLEVSINNFKDVEKLPGFQPIYLFPKLEKKHQRVWGFILQNEIIYFFRIKTEEEVIQTLVEGFYSLRSDLAGYQNLWDSGVITGKTVRDECARMIKLCTSMLEFYQEIKNTQENNKQI